MRRLVIPGRENCKGEGPKGRRTTRIPYSENEWMVMVFPGWDFSQGPVWLSDSCFPVECRLGLLYMHFLLVWSCYHANPSLKHSCITPHPH